jgi:tRNA-specific 2-thiouridylase
MKALVAMSGGVDSSVAAALMLEDGYEVIGVTLKQWEDADGELPAAGCCTLADANDARSAARRLGIPYYVLDYVDRFRTEVVDRFGEMYMAGLTPNPCIECNRRVRFDALLERTAELGCDVLVTGHHARIRREAGRNRLLRATDGTKDQSYVLHMLGQDALARIRFPVGEMTKAAVREHAARLGFRTAEKPDSQDLCFVGDGDYREFLRDHFPEVARPGLMIDVSGEVVGRHDGVIDFTVGQRRGLGIAAGERRYVTGIDAGTATVTIGPRPALQREGCRVGGVTFVAGDPPRCDAVQVKIRYRSPAVPARIEPTGEAWAVRFDNPQTGVAPGQAAVFYDGDEVLGGGTILPGG